MFKSLRIGMLVTIIVAVVLGAGCGVLTNTIFKKWIDNKYNSEEYRNERYKEYVADLQTYVSTNKLSSHDTDKILDWVSDNRNIYLFIYKDDVLFFDSSIVTPDKDKNEDNKNPPSEDEENSGGEATEDESKTDAEDSEKESGKTESEKDENDNKNDKENDSVGGGITIQYPSREEIIESAKGRGQMPLEMSDGSLLVSIADFTEYIYYDAANIVSIVVGVLILTIVLMLYFQNILSKISALAKDVTDVYKVDMNTPIRTRKGDNELAELTRNVEEMRSSMMLSLEKEKEAINANTELITSMSHDIRTPLTVLLGYLDVMKNATNDAGMMEYIKASEVTAMRLKDLSDDMFRYFLVFGEGNINAELEEYSSRTLVVQLLSEHILLLKEKGYSIVVSESEDICDDVLVLTDAPKIMRVVDNVFSNIYKYADIEKDITIKTMLETGYLSITVSNYKTKKSSEAESNGVGLKTCKKLCEAIGARFECTEKSEIGAEEFLAKIDIPIAKAGERAENEA